ncbi:MAG: YqaJ viral recombinase family protein [Bacteroidota bacterium]
MSSTSAIVLASTLSGMDRTTWLTLRRRGIYGSDARLICGVYYREFDGHLETATDVWLEKRGCTAAQEEAELDLDENIARAFSLRTGVIVRRRGVILQHPEHPFMLADLNRVTHEAADGIGVLVVMSGGLELLRNWEQVQEAFRIHALHDMAVTGYTYAHLAALVPGNHGLELRLARVVRDERAISCLIEIEREFWENNVQTNTPPVGNTQATAKLLATLYPESRSMVVELPPSAREFFEGYDRADQVVREAEEHREHYANLLKGMLMDAEAGVLDEYKAVWRTTDGRRQFSVIKN